jgi:DNA mismatch endonuclease (patch repair protein)
MDKLTRQRRSENMRRIKGKDTKPELIVRRIAHSLGYRYRVHRKDLPGKPDLVFPSRRKVVFVHGCFWHQHEKLNCLDSRRPKSNVAYWQPKLDRNVSRDRVHTKELEGDGWKVLVVWDCETGDTAGLARRLRRFLGSIRKTHI